MNKKIEYLIEYKDDLINLNHKELRISDGETMLLIAYQTHWDEQGSNIIGTLFDGLSGDMTLILNKRNKGIWQYRFCDHCSSRYFPVEEVINILIKLIK